MNRNIFVNFLNILLIILMNSCIQDNRKEELVSVVDNKNNKIEKGLLVNGKREGYWVTFDTNYVVQYDIQYKNDIPNGKVTHYYEGRISIEAEERNGIRNGKFTSYHAYPIIATEGYVKNGERIGEWKTYSKEGKLNRIIQFEKDTFKITLDNNLE